MFIDLILFLGALAPAPQTSSAFVELMAGRMNLASDQGVQSFLGATPEQKLAEWGHLELGPTGRTVVRWSGQGSINLRGKSSMEWSGSPFTGTPAELFDFDHVELEIRRGELGLQLPGGVLLIGERAALELEQRSSGVFGVHHLGGEPAILVIPALGGPTRRQLTAGQWTWIDPGEAVRTSRFSSAQRAAQAKRAAPIAVKPAPKPVVEMLAEPVIQPIVEPKQSEPLAIEPPAAPLPQPAVFLPWTPHYTVTEGRSSLDLRPQGPSH